MNRLVRWTRGILARWSHSPTNIDAVIGKHGIVYQAITRNEAGLVRIEGEEWRARSGDDIDEGEEVKVVGVRGVTLEVEKLKERG